MSITRAPAASPRIAVSLDPTVRHSSTRRGQALVEFALVIPILLTLVLGAVDFGRVMQGRVTSESTAKAGAQWGGSHLQNATQELDPAFTLSSSGGNCGSSGGTAVKYPPSCNVLARSCAEAASFPGYSAGAPIAGFGSETYYTCLTGTTANVCNPSATQSNPVLGVTWAHGGVAFTPAPIGTAGQKPVIGDTVTVTGTFCFKTFFPGPMSRLTWTSSATYTVQP